MKEKNEILRELPFWGKLTDEEKKAVELESQIVHYDKGQMIFSATEECLGMIHIIEGRLRTYIVSEEGREITLFKLNSGETCVLSASCAISQIDFETEMMADEQCDILLLRIRFFERLMKKNIYVENFTNELIADRFSKAMWVMQQIMFFGIDRRIAVFLINESDRKKSETIKMTHEEIAREINSAREVVARMMKRFEVEGLVQLKRGQIIIKDLEGLRNLT